jgi:hypothetical protein
MQAKRYHCYDDEGMTRSFDSKEEANEWIKVRPELRLVVVPRKKVVKPDVFKLVGECPF